MSKSRAKVKVTGAKKYVCVFCSLGGLPSTERQSCYYSLTKLACNKEIRRDHTNAKTHYIYMICLGFNT